MPSQTNPPSNLVDLLCDRAQYHPERTAFIFLKDGETEAGRLTYAQVDQQARAIATRLNELVQPGDRVVLVYPYEAGLEFITAFLGCLYAQVVAVPCHPPRNQQGLADLVARLVSAEAKTMLTTRSLLSPLKRQLSAQPDLISTLHWCATDESQSSYAPWTPPPITPDTLAFLQYTSGSTGKPKGVKVTHSCLWYNQQMLQTAFEHTEACIGLGWLPLFHDMGLIGNVVQSLYVGATTVLMSPLAFVQKPVRWLNAIARYRATTSGGPNFAYDLLCRYVTPSQRDRLDLRCWDVAFCGAETVRSATLDRFVNLFQGCGFRREAFYLCYGMAEATLFVTGGKKDQSPRVLQVDGEALARQQVAIAPALSPRTQTLVSCGTPWLESRVAIVNPETCEPCPAPGIGEIWVAGAGLGRGYWQQPELTAQTFQATLTQGEGQFLRTGDLGFLYDGELFVTGRLHDVMVFWGFNHYPQHIETTVEACHAGFRDNGCAAFSATIAGEERLVIAQEVERQYRDRLTIAEVLETVRWEVFQAHFVDVGAFLLIKPGGLPRTSSGKIQRSRCKAQFLEGRLNALEGWQSSEQTDIPSLMRRYFNPLTHLQRYANRFTGQFARSVQKLRQSKVHRK